MVFVLLSPAKTMAFDRPRPHIEGSVPFFQDQAVQLADALKKLPPKKLGALMTISDKLAALNVERFQNFAATPKSAQSDLALLAYRGDTYVGLDARTLTDAQLKTAQKHIGILSGLYGLLHPLDLIQPYRLEMATPLTIGSKKDLYAYWGNALTDAINAHVKKHKLKAVIGCASTEYLAAVDTQKLAVPFIHCDFKEKKNGKLQTVGILAKRARGMMARYVIDDRIANAKELKDFTGENYVFDKSLSTDGSYVFTR